VPRWSSALAISSGFRSSPASLVTRGSIRSFVALPYHKTFRLAWQTMVVSPALPYHKTFCLAWETMVVSPPPMCAGKCLNILRGDPYPEENPEVTT
jgi:hypothetical protein